MHDYGTRLRQLREQRGLNQRELGELVGVPQQQISHLENGRREIKLPFAAELARALGVTVNDLVPVEAQAAEAV